jgi:phenylpropionate dioxygenase-like ring-hydroxylating dioxygenase large terminal subunit
MGELLRRYWQPAALSADLGDRPRKTKILCEEFVLFRDKKGRVGALHPHCAHRGTSLEWGRVEEDGLRCCYHGWKYDTEGKCVDMPCETKEFRESMNVRQPAYPTLEFGGLIFVYMGPPEKQPLFPLYDIIDTRYRNDVVIRGMQIWGDCSIGYVRDCNWLQHYENVVDPYHLLILHQYISGDQFQGVLMQGKWPEISFEDTDIGVRYRFVRDLPNGNRLLRYVECVVPNIYLVSNIHEDGSIPKDKDRASEVSWAVPVDNEHVTSFSLVAWPRNESGEPEPRWRPRTDTVLDIRPGSVRARPYDERQRKPDDMEAQESQRTIAVHALENLAHSDTGIVKLRRALRRSIAAIGEGRDPMNIVRDAGKNHAIPTHAWNSVIPIEKAEDAA